MARRSAAVYRFVLVPFARLCCLIGAIAVPALSAQEIDAVPTVADLSGSAAPSGVFGALGTEAKLYLDDAKSLVTAPLHWGSEDRLKAASVVGLVGGLMIFDEQLARESQERRSSFTNRVSKITTGLGSADAFLVSGSLLASGVIFHDQRLSLMGREAIEASAFAGLIASILKPTFGRQRPIASNNETVFEPGSKNYLFPSGHSTEAFCVASVVAARSEGWVVPTLAYTRPRSSPSTVSTIAPISRATLSRARRSASSWDASSCTGTRTPGSASPCGHFHHGDPARPRVRRPVLARPRTNAPVISRRPG